MMMMIYKDTENNIYNNNTNTALLLLLLVILLLLILARCYYCHCCCYNCFYCYPTTTTTITIIKKRCQRRLVTASPIKTKIARPSPKEPCMFGIAFKSAINPLIYSITRHRHARGSLVFPPRTPPRGATLGRRDTDTKQRRGRQADFGVLNFSGLLAGFLLLTISDYAFGLFV